MLHADRTGWDDGAVSFSTGMVLPWTAVGSVAVKSHSGNGSGFVGLEHRWYMAVEGGEFLREVTLVAQPPPLGQPRLWFCVRSALVGVDERLGDGESSSLTVTVPRGSES
jgi:hypothetical protein